MLVIARWMVLRFLRLWVWVPALVVPFAIGPFLFTGPSTLDSALVVTLDVLVYLLPTLAMLFVLTAVDRARWGLVVSHPAGIPDVLLGTWLGGVLPFLVCHVLLSLAATGAVYLFQGERSARVYYSTRELWRGDPGARVPLPSGSLRERVEWLESDEPWTVKMEGLPADTALEGKIVAHVGFVVTEDEAGHHDHGGRKEEASAGKTFRLFRARQVSATVHFPDGSGRDRCPPVAVQLRNRKPATITIPVEAISSEGRLVAVIRRQGEEGPPHPGEGPTIFWFDEVRDGNSVFDSGLLLIRRRGALHENFFRSALQTTGVLYLVVGAATFAAASFGAAVAFAFSLCLFVCGAAMTFLREVVASLSVSSTAVLLADPAARPELRPPTWFDQALQKFLDFWVTVLPDFETYRGAGYLENGDMIRWLTVGHAQGVGAGYAVAFLLVATLLLIRWEAGR